MRLIGAAVFRSLDVIEKGNVGIYRSVYHEDGMAVTPLTSVRPLSSPESRRVSTEPNQARTEEEPSVVTALSGEPTQPLRREGIRAKHAKEVSRPSRSPEASLSPATASPPTTQSSGLTGSPRAATPEPSLPSPAMPAAESTGGSSPETTERVATAPIEDPASQTLKAPVIVRSIPGAHSPRVVIDDPSTARSTEPSTERD